MGKNHKIEHKQKKNLYVKLITEREKKESKYSECLPLKEILSKDKKSCLEIFKLI